MTKVTLFYLNGCPYCRNARKAVDELRAEKAAYGGLELEWIEESLQPDIAGQYDYYYVPSAFLAGEKLYECSPADGFAEIKAALRIVFDRALAS